MWGSLLHIFTNTCYDIFLILAILVGLKWHFIVVVIYIFLLAHWKRLWCWEELGAGGEGDDRGWDGWMASPTRWMWVWVNSAVWWWTGRPGVLWFMGSQRVRHNWAIELNWIANNVEYLFIFLLAVCISLEKCLFSSFPQCACYFHH